MFRLNRSRNNQINKLPENQPDSSSGFLCLWQTINTLERLGAFKFGLAGNNRIGFPSSEGYYQLSLPAEPIIKEALWLI